MSDAVRICLMIAAIGMFAFVIKNVRDSKIRTEVSFFWIVFSFFIMLIGIFPDLMVTIAGWLGIQSAANLVFLVIIFLLIIKLYHMDRKEEKLRLQLQQLLQKIAIGESEKKETK